MGRQLIETCLRLIIHHFLTHIVNELQRVYVLVSMKIRSMYWSFGSHDLLGL